MRQRLPFTLSIFGEPWRIIEGDTNHLCLAGKNRAALVGVAADCGQKIKNHPLKIAQSLRFISENIHLDLGHHPDRPWVQAVRFNPRR
jgi:hypothetical protein